MNSRDRILTTLRHREPDRVPLGFDSWPGIRKQLFARFGVQNTQALFDAMGIDGFSVFESSYVYPDYIGPERPAFADGTKPNFFGIASLEYGPPLAFAQSAADLDRYLWPRADWFDYRTVKERCLAIKARGQVTVGGEGGCGVQHAINLRGYQQALMDPLVDPDFTQSYLQRMGDFFVEWNERWLTAAEGEFDIYRCGDEIGSNTAPHCSPEIWREFYKPQLKRIFAVAKRHGLKIWFHCCGYCRPLLPDLLEIGVDMWDPAPGYVRDNDLPAIKRECGDRLTFVGGIDQPNVLVVGTPRDVEAEVRRRIEQLAPGGGYILGPSQCFTDDVPVENIVAMYAAALRYGRYA